MDIKTENKKIYKEVSNRMHVLQIVTNNLLLITLLDDNTLFEQLIQPDH
jgi:hypothetical protein